MYRLSRVAGVRTVPSGRNNKRRGTQGMGKGGRHRTVKHTYNGPTTGSIRKPASPVSPTALPRSPVSPTGSTGRGRRMALSKDQQLKLTEMAYVRAWQRYFALGEESLMWQQKNDALQLLFVNEKLDGVLARINLLGSMLDARRRYTMDLAAKLTQYEQLVDRMYRILKANRQKPALSNQHKLRVIVSMLRSPKLVDDLTEAQRETMMQKAFRKYNPIPKRTTTGQYHHLTSIPLSLTQSHTLQSLTRRQSHLLP